MDAYHAGRWSRSETTRSAVTRQRELDAIRAAARRVVDVCNLASSGPVVDRLAVVSRAATAAVALINPVEPARADPTIGALEDPEAEVTALCRGSVLMGAEGVSGGGSG